MEFQFPQLLDEGAATEDGGGCNGHASSERAS